MALLQLCPLAADSARPTAPARRRGAILSCGFLSFSFSLGARSAWSSSTTTRDSVSSSAGVEREIVVFIVVMREADDCSSIVGWVGKAQAARPDGNKVRWPPQLSIMIGNQVTACAVSSFIMWQVSNAWDIIQAAAHTGEVFHADSMEDCLLYCRVGSRTHRIHEPEDGRCCAAGRGTGFGGQSPTSRKGREKWGTRGGVNPQHDVGHQFDDADVAARRPLRDRCQV